LQALLDRGYSAEDCRKILGGNLLRVFREVEQPRRNCKPRIGPRLPTNSRLTSHKNSFPLLLNI
jgi:Membrane dipeptidase (Peptidase family M19)